LVVQANEFNESRIATVVVAALTSNLRLSLLPGNVEIPAGKAGLKEPSVVNVSQMMSLDRSTLLERAGCLPTRLMAAVDDGIRLVLAV
jgi:mRNA interferase MazF